MNFEYFNGYEYNKFQSRGFNNTSLEIQDSYLYHYHMGDFIKKLYAVFDIENLPVSMSKRLIFNAVFLGGVGCVFRSEAYGLLFQPCSFRDFNVNYDPVYAVVDNPYMQTAENTYKIGDDCELLHFDTNYCSVLEWLDFFATLKAQLTGTVINQGRTLNNPYVFACDDVRVAKSFKALADKVSGGDPFIFGDKRLFNTSDGSLSMQMFNKELKKNFILQEVYEIIEEIEQEFLQTIGVPRMYFKKRERMTDDEVNKNDVNTSLLRDSWLDTLNECCERINKKFDTEMRFKIRSNIVNGGESNAESQASENLL